MRYLKTFSQLNMTRILLVQADRFLEAWLAPASLKDMFPEFSC